MNAATREQAIAIAAEIFAARDLANCKDPRIPRHTRSRGSCVEGPLSR
jgi:hypothetical protein